VGIFSTFSSLKYELAIVIEKDTKVANMLEILSYFILLTASLLISLIIGFLVELNISIGSIIIDESYYFIGLITLLIGVFTIQTNRLNREENYTLIAISNLINKIAVVSSQVIFGLLGMGAYGLIIGNIFGYLVSTLVNYFFGLKNSKILNNFILQNLFHTARIHKKFPRYTVGQSFFNTTSHQLPVILLGYYYGLDYVGYYWMAMRVIQIPTLLFGESIRKVFYRKISDSTEQLQEALAIYKKYIFVLSLIIFLPVIIIFFFNEYIFSFILGKDWLISAEFAKWLFIWIGVGFISQPASAVVLAFGINKFGFYYDLTLLFARMLVLVIGGLYFDILSTIIAYTIVGVIFNLALIYICYRFISKKS